MASRRRNGSSPPTSNAPFAAPVSVAASGPVTQRMIPASFKASAREPIVAPAASKSASLTEAACPAPFSTARLAPSAINFFTVSGMAAQRDSPSGSLSTAIFMGAPGSGDDEQDDDPDRKRGDRAV